MLGEKIYDCRKKNGISQEVLAEKLGVARQTISNWETGETSPNPEQLKMISNFFNVSIDELLDNTAFIKPSENNSDGRSDIFENTKNARIMGFEYKSKAMFRGLPLVHINIGGVIPRKAKGVVAIGDIAQGIIALGGISMGLVSVGGMSLGLVSIGGLAIGLIVALGGGALAPVACGGGAIGLVACGGDALGYITNMK